MKGQGLAPLIAVVVLIGMTGALLGKLKSRQRLGPPGVKLINKPIYDENGNIAGPVSVGLPETVLDYSSTNAPIQGVELSFLPKDTTYGRKRYQRSDGTFTDVTVVLMGTDRTSIHKPEFCLVGQGWKRSEPELFHVPIERPHRYDLPVMRILGTRSVKKPNGEVITGRAVYVYWFVAENRLTAMHRDRFWYSLTDLVTAGVLPRWAYVSCFSICWPGDEEATFERVKRFIAAAVPEFQSTTGAAILPAAPSEPSATAAVQ